MSKKSLKLSILKANIILAMTAPISSEVDSVVHCFPEGFNAGAKNANGRGKGKKAKFWESPYKFKQRR